MKASVAVVALAAAVSCVAGHIFSDSFNDGNLDGWTYSTHPGKEFGKFVVSHGAFYNNPEADQGIKTSEDARFYGLSTKFPPKSNKDETLVIQFSVKHEQNIDCGGGYLKVFDCSLDPKDLHGETPYKIMFGPDICGPGTKKVHVIINYKGKNIAINKDIRCKDDIYTHYYTLIIRPDNTYEVLIDNEKVESGNLEEDFNFLPPKKIKDPDAVKPQDWDDRATIPDPDDKKPVDWDQPEHIPDTDATKPEDWDDEMDGNWDPPMKDNPDFKGEWTPKQIDNPNYKGVWKHPEIDNPDYTPDPELYVVDEICGAGFDLWQVKAGTIFDNVLITLDPKEAKEAAENWKATYDGEKKMKETQDEEERKKEEASKPAEKDDEDDDDDEEEVAEKPETGEETHDEL